MGDLPSSDFLFSQPTALTGATRLVDLGAQFDGYNISVTPQEADRRALAVDWLLVGGALYEALKQELEGLRTAKDHQLNLDLR